MLTRDIVQIAYFVTDAKAAALRMATAFGAGPFFLAERIELAWCEYRGVASDFVHTSAYGQWGDVMMELVQQDSEGPSPFRDMYGKGEEGIHHVAIMVESMTETYAHYQSLGFAVAARAETRSGVEFAFIDTTAALGHMIEIYQGTPQLRGFYAFVKEASRDWDGSDPLRPLDAEVR